jgi:hypothetical protein
MAPACDRREMCRHVLWCKACGIASRSRWQKAQEYRVQYRSTCTCPVKESSVPWACGRFPKFKPYQDRKRAPHFSQETEFEHATAVSWTTALDTTEYRTGQSRLETSKHGRGRNMPHRCVRCHHKHVVVFAETEHWKAASKACIARVYLRRCYFHSHS